MENGNCRRVWQCWQCIAGAVGGFYTIKERGPGRRVATSPKAAEFLIFWPSVAFAEKAVGGTAAKLRACDPRASTERRHCLEQAMSQGQHGHDDVFGYGRLMAKHVADGDPFRHRPGVEEIEAGRHRLQQAQARRGWKSGAPI